MEGGNDSLNGFLTLVTNKQSSDDAFYLYIQGYGTHWQPGIHLTEFVLSYS